MAIMCLTTTYLSVNSQDWSSYIKSATVTVNVEEQDVTTFGSDGWREVHGGLKAGTVAVEYLDDFADSALDDDHWALLGTKVAFEFRPTESAVGSGNPKYTGTILINSHSVGGAVGSMAGKSLTYPTSATVTRAEA